MKYFILFVLNVNIVTSQIEISMAFKDLTKITFPSLKIHFLKFPDIYIFTVFLIVGTLYNKINTCWA